GADGIPGTPIHALDEYMAMIPGNDEVVLTELLTNDVLQPGGKNSFNPTQNAVVFKNRTAKVRQCKVDLEFTHTQIMAFYKSYLGQIAAKKIDPSKLPFEEHIIAEVVKRVKENLRVKSLYNSVYNPAGSSPLDVFDGLSTQITAAIASGDVPAANIAAANTLTGGNAVGELEKIVAVISDAYFYSGVVCVCSRKQKTFYEADYRARYGSLPYNSSTEKGFIDGTNIPFVVEPGYAGDFPIFTPKGNLAYLYDDEGKVDNLDFEYTKKTRSLAYIMDFQAATGIAAAELIWGADN
ncbi:MAG: hypothetical protein J7576_18505, partial [Siphonobacter aquaeclarae]|nr:hypothetical protein [Siphonobacter aquaeclarae]